MIINSRCIKHLYVRVKTVILSGEKIGRSKSLRLWIRQWLLNYNTKRQTTEGKRNKLDFIKVKNFIPQRTASKSKRKPKELEKHL